MSGNTIPSWMEMALTQAQLLARRLTAELSQLYAAQEAYLARHEWTAWCDTPFAKRIAQLEAELGI